MAKEKAPGIRVFVYGTLKRGHGNHSWFLDREDVDFLGRAVVTGPYRMCDLGYFPAVVRDDSGDTPDNSTIVGEVYRVPPEILDALDVLEGHPEWYHREQVQTPWKRAWLYFMPGLETKDAAICEDGIWSETPEEREFFEEWRSGTEG